MSTSTDVPVVVPTTKEEPAKKLNMPKPFTGKRQDYKKFMQDVLLYIRINHKIYETDEDKIIFTLSFFNDSDAATWKEQWVEEKFKQDPVNFGNWNDFANALNTAFLPYDAPGDALDEMKNMKLGDGSIENHVSNFKMAVTRSGLDKDSSAVVDYFRDSLTIPLQKRIMTLENPPTTLDKWCEWAMKMDNNYKKMQRVIGRSRQGKTDAGKRKDETPRRWVFQKKDRDPNAMDVDAITTERRAECLKKGLCFGCGKPGHLGINCPDKQPSASKPPTYASTWRSTPPAPKKMNGKELLAHVRALTAQMDDGEKEKFYDEAEKEGF
jgi:hypothetical protein